MSWKIYTYACEYAQGLKLHNLDGDDDSASFGKSEIDANRKGFWELIQLDLFFRLILSKPPTLTANMNSWRVNLPWLSTEPEPHSLGVPTMTFLVSSRVTFILARFFQVLDHAKRYNDPELLPKVEDLCSEIVELYVEWQYVRNPRFDVGVVRVDIVTG